jgi:sortase A
VKRAVAVILIITGLALMAYPKLKEYYYDRKQAQLLEAWRQSLEVLEQDPEQVEDMPGDDGTGGEEAGAAEDWRTKYIEQNMEGVLKIDKINLNMPILRGATERDLLISASSLEGTAGPGEVGNYCIAGHRGRTTGRHFNKLDRLKEGDIIEVITKDVTYQYEVFENIIVKPEDTWVLAPQGEERLITLITCDYSEEPSLRLIVRGRLKVEEEDSSCG